MDQALGMARDSLAQFYREQPLDGVQENLARFDREKNEGAAQALIEEYDTEANGSCGQVADEMAHTCDRMPEFSSDFSDVTSIQCHFGNELKLRKQDGTIRFYTTRDAPNQSEFISSFLRNF